MDADDEASNMKSTQLPLQIRKRRHSVLEMSDSVVEGVENLAPATKYRELDTLPFLLYQFSDEVLFEIFKHLDSWTLLALMNTCDRFNNLVQDYRFWSDIDLSKEPLPLGMLESVLERTHQQTRTIKLRGPPSAQHVDSEIQQFNKTLVATFASRCTKLKVLELQGVTIDFRFLRIQNFPKTLNRLILDDCQARIPEPEVKSIFWGIDTHLLELEELGIENSDWFEPHYIMKFSKAPALRWLSLKGCRHLRDFVPYGSMASRFGFKRLEYLDMRFTPINDADVQCFTAVLNLKELLLENPQDTHCMDDAASITTTSTPSSTTSPTPPSTISTPANTIPSTSTPTTTILTPPPTTTSTTTTDEPSTSSASSNSVSASASVAARTPKVSRAVRSAGVCKRYRKSLCLSKAKERSTKYKYLTSRKVPSRSAVENVHLLPLLSSSSSSSSSSPSSSSSSASSSSSSSPSSPSPSPLPTSPAISSSTQSTSPTNSDPSSPLAPAATAAAAAISIVRNGNMPGHSRFMPRPDQIIYLDVHNRSRPLVVSGPSRRPLVNGNHSGGEHLNQVLANPIFWDMISPLGRRARSVAAINGGDENDHQAASRLRYDHNELITDRGLCFFGRPTNAGNDAIVWVRIGYRPNDNRIERLIVRNYRQVTDRTLRHLALSSPSLLYLDLSGTGVTRAGVQRFKERRPECQLIVDHLIDCNDSSIDIEKN